MKTETFKMFMAMQNIYDRFLLLFEHYTYVYIYISLQCSIQAAYSRFQDWIFFILLCFGLK